MSIKFCKMRHKMDFNSWFLNAYTYVIYCILLNQLPSFYFIQDLKFDLIEIPVFIFMAVIGKILLSHILFNK